MNATRAAASPRRSLAIVNRVLPARCLACADSTVTLMSAGHADAVWCVSCDVVYRHQATA